ncbi:MAG: hypothetical protein IT330_11785 [Anaerolineae bacterium]|nr:hypothetical protein [Anaerolineae bacterium]
MRTRRGVAAKRPATLGRGRKPSLRSGPRAAGVEELPDSQFGPLAQARLPHETGSGGVCPVTDGRLQPQQKANRPGNG